MPIEALLRLNLDPSVQYPSFVYHRLRKGWGYGAAAPPDFNSAS